MQKHIGSSMAGFPDVTSILFISLFTSLIILARSNTLYYYILCLIPLQYL